MADRNGSAVSMIRLRAVARKEFIQLYRDPRSLAIIFAMPLLLLLLFGYAVTLDITDVQVAVYDQERSEQSREFIRRFDESKYFRLAADVGDYADLTRLIDLREAQIGLVIPYDFSRTLNSGRQTAVQVLLDGSDANTANIILGYIRSVVQGYSQSVLFDYLGQQGFTDRRIPVELRPRVWFNEELESKNYIVPGLIALIMAVIGALLTSLTISREWERGTMEQLVATPVHKLELMIGKLLPYYLLAVLDVAIAMGVGVLIFQVPFRGSLPLFFFLSSLFLFVVLGQGFLISVIAKSQMLANQMALVSTYLPVFLLSGFMFSIANMPVALQLVTILVPARYFVTILQGLFLKGIGLAILWPEMLALALFVAVIGTLAHRRFSKTIT
ncbi:MAG TPA: ABC transporter permease [Nitrospiria bacterium]|nr:ABC transporter permease [Nitrospiria bacterium]